MAFKYTCFRFYGKTHQNSDFIEETIFNILLTFFETFQVIFKEFDKYFEIGFAFAKCCI